MEDGSFLKATRVPVLGLQEPVGHFSLLTIRQNFAGWVFCPTDGAFLKKPLVFSPLFAKGRRFFYAWGLASRRNQKDNTPLVLGFFRDWLAATFLRRRGQIGPKRSLAIGKEGRVGLKAGEPVGSLSYLLSHFLESLSRVSGENCHVRACRIFCEDRLLVPTPTTVVVGSFR